MWSMLTYCELKSKRSTEAILVVTNQDGFFTHEERGYKVWNARVELAQITGLDHGAQ